MKLITMDSDAYRLLLRKIEQIFAYVKHQEEVNATAQPDPATVWIDNDESAALLEVGKRTLQRLRTAGEIGYSIRGGRVYYTLAEVQRLVAGHVIKSKFEQEADLIRAHQEYRKQHRRKI